MKQILIRTEQIERSIDAKMDVEWRSENAAVTKAKYGSKDESNKVKEGEGSRTSHVHVGGILRYPR